MFSTIYKQRRSFPELVGRNVQQATAYVTELGIVYWQIESYVHWISFFRSGFQVDILRRNDPMTKDFRMDRVRIIVDPTRTIVIQTPVVG